MKEASLNSLANFLSLPELKILEINPQQGWMKCKSTLNYSNCPHCQARSTSGYDKRLVSIKDCPLAYNKHFCEIRLIKRRFRCLPCNRVFTESISGIRKGRRTTERFRAMIMWACDRFASLKQVREDYKVSSDFVYKAFYEQLELKRRMNNQYAWPREIGIDEHGFGKDKKLRRKVYVSMVVNQSRKKLMEVVFGKSKSIMMAQLGHIPGRENVEYVTIDMCDPYRSFIREFFPNAQIIADKFHVLRLLSPAIMKERRKIVGKNADRKARSLLLCNSKELDFFDRRAIHQYLKRHKHLNEMYHAKEALHSFYNIKGHRRACKAMEFMIERFKNSETKEVRKLGNTLHYWKDEVLNYFRKKLTNARLEGFNNKASLVKRRAYGYRNPNNYRLRLLNVCG